MKNVFLSPFNKYKQRFGELEFEYLETLMSWTSYTCRIFHFKYLLLFSAGRRNGKNQNKSKFKIQHVQIDELPRTLKLHKCNHALILYLLLVGDNPRGIVMRRLCNLERSQRPRQSSQRGGKTSTRTWNPVPKLQISLRPDQRWMHAFHLHTM